MRPPSQPPNYMIVRCKKASDNYIHNLKTAIVFMELYFIFAIY